MSQINTNLAQLLGSNVQEFSGAMELNALAQGRVKSTFDIQVKLSLKMHITYQWWKSAEGKQAMEYAGIVMTTEEFRDIWGYKKAFFSEMINLGKLRENESNKISDYKSDTDNRSVRGCLKFAKDGGAEAEAEAEAEGEAEAEAVTEEKTNYIVSFAIKGEHFEDGKGVSVRIAESGSVEGDLEKLPKGLQKELAKLSSQIALKQPNAIVETKGKGWSRSESK